MQRTLSLRAGILSLALLALILLGWQVAVSGSARLPSSSFGPSTSLDFSRAYTYQVGMHA